MTSKLNQAYSDIAEYYTEKIDLLVAHLYREHNYTEQQVGMVLGVTKQAVNSQYGKKRLLK